MSLKRAGIMAAVYAAAVYAAVRIRRKKKKKKEEKKAGRKKTPGRAGGKKNGNAERGPAPYHTLRAGASASALGFCGRQQKIVLPDADR
jgi:hypothetical protein